MLPRGWRQAVDAKGRAFYYNRELSKKQWERPESAGAVAGAPSSSYIHKLGHALRVAFDEAMADQLMHQLDIGGETTEADNMLASAKRCYLFGSTEGSRAAADGDIQATAADDVPISQPRMSGYMLVGRNSDVQSSWCQSWVQLDSGCIRLQQLTGKRNSEHIELGPKFRVSEMTIGAQNRAHVQPSLMLQSKGKGTVRGFKLWARDCKAAPYYFVGAGDSLKRWILDIRTSCLVAHIGSLTAEQRLVELCFSIAFEAISFQWAAPHHNASQWGALTAEETCWEMCNAALENTQSGVDLVERATTELWTTIVTNCSAIRGRVMLLRQDIIREKVLSKQDALVASLMQKLAPSVTHQIEQHVIPQLKAALQILIDPLCASWRTLIPHWHVLSNLVLSLSPSASVIVPDSHSCAALRNALFFCLDDLREASSNTNTGNSRGHDGREVHDNRNLVSEVLNGHCIPAAILAARAICSYISVRDVVRAISHVRRTLGAVEDDMATAASAYCDPKLSQEGPPPELPRTARKAKLGSRLETDVVHQACSENPTCT
eukprot:COSAG05_NODE_462_length_9561_cov_5.923378_8_plen_548_part_00